MIGMKKILKTLYCILFITSFSQGQVVINEVMASNTGILKNPVILNYDWIELYNAGEQEVNLAGMGISDNSSIKHVFASSGLKIAPKGYLLLLASGLSNAGLIHLNFSLSSEGETIRLFSVEGKLISSFSYPALRKDISYGRKADGGRKVRFFADASPGTTNNVQQAFKKVTKQPKFSNKGGFSSKAFGLKISKFLSFADIYYTLDGSEPSIHDTVATKYEYKKNYQENPGDPVVNQKFSDSKRSFFYKGKIQLTPQNQLANRYSLIPTTFTRNASYLPQSYVPKSQVVRAVAIKKGRLPSEIVTSTYFFEDNKKSPYTFPIVSLAFNPEDLFDYNRGIYVAGNGFDNFRKSSSETTALCTPGNYSNSGSFWERDASFEFFENSVQKICQPITARIHGGCSRSFPYKSFKLFSDDNFDKYDLIKAQKTHNQASVVLRNSGNDYNKTLFKDVFIHQLVKPLKIPIQEYRPSILYLNGEYWGIHNLRDRVDNDYLNKIYGVDKKNIDLIKVVFDGPVEIEYGDDEAYKSLKSFFMNNNFTDNSLYEKALEKMDIENFIDYQIVEIFVGNIDWPQNNVRLWRVKTEKANKAPNDGKWRWVFFDADRSLGETVPVGHNNLKDAINRPQNFIFSKLLQNKTFKTKFVARFTELLDSTFKYENSSKLYLQIKKVYEPEMEIHLKRWRIIGTKNQWERNCQDVLDYLKNRPGIMRNHLKEEFGILYNEVTILNPGAEQIEVDDKLVKQSIRKYIQTDSLIKISPIKSESSNFSHWLIGGKAFYETELELKINSDTTVLAVFENIKTKETPKVDSKKTKEYTLTRGLSPNQDGINEYLELQLLNEDSEVEFFRVFDKNGQEKSVFWTNGEENGNFNIHFNTSNSLSKGTLFYVLKFKNTAEIYSDFLTIAY